MNIESFREYCLSLDGTTEKMPFGKFARRYDSLLVFYVLNHMFCIVDINNFTSVTVRSTPDEIEELIARHTSVSKPLNPALRHWVQLDMGGDIPDTMILSLVLRSYNIIKSRYTPKKSIK